MKCDPQPANRYITKYYGEAALDYFKELGGDNPDPVYLERFKIDHMALTERLRRERSLEHAVARQSDEPDVDEQTGGSTGAGGGARTNGGARTDGGARTNGGGGGGDGVQTGGRRRMRQRPAAPSVTSPSAARVSSDKRPRGGSSPRVDGRSDTSAPLAERVGAAATRASRRRG